MWRKDIKDMSYIDIINSQLIFFGVEWFWQLTIYLAVVWEGTSLYDGKKVSYY